MTNAEKVIRPWSPTIDLARAEFEELLRTYGAQIPHDKGAQAFINFRDMVGNMFPGALPAPAAVAIMTIVSANALSSMMEQIEGSLVGETPEAIGRRKAIVNIFEDVLNRSADMREAVRLKRLSGMQGIATN